MLGSVHGPPYTLWFIITPCGREWPSAFRFLHSVVYTLWVRMATCMALPLQCSLHPVGESGHRHGASFTV
jgi:hypothetical protein